MKAVLRGKFTGLRTYIKDMEKSHIRNLTVQVKDLEQKEANEHMRSR